MRLPARIAAFLLDLDGTLVDSEPMHWATALTVMAEEGVDVGDPSLMPEPGWGELEFWREMRSRFGLASSPEALADRRTAVFVERLRAEVLAPRPGALALLTALGDTPRMIVSASPREQVETIVAAAGLGEFFRGEAGHGAWVSGHEDVERSKPAPDVYRLAAERLGVEAEDCVAVEDSVTGMSAALASGAFTVVVPTEQSDELRRAHCVLGSLEELASAFAARKTTPG